MSFGVWRNMSWRFCCAHSVEKRTYPSLGTLTLLGPNGWPINRPVNASVILFSYMAVNIVPHILLLLTILVQPTNSLRNQSSSSISKLHAATVLVGLSMSIDFVVGLMWSNLANTYPFCEEVSLSDWISGTAIHTSSSVSIMEFLASRRDSEEFSGVAERGWRLCANYPRPNGTIIQQIPLYGTLSPDCLWRGS